MTHRLDDPPRQLPLDLALRSGRTLANFVTGASPQALDGVERLLDAGHGGVVYLWGPAGSGKTHLLEGSCARMAARDAALGYVPMREREALAPGMLVGLGGASLVCIDDVDAIAGHAGWEEGLFHLYNDIEGRGTRLLLAARRTPRAAGFALPDLESRLAAGLVLRVDELDDAGRRAALRMRASERGFDFPDDVVSFVLSRCPRDMHSLFSLFDRLERSTLAAQRRLSVSFVKALLESQAK